MNAPYLYLDAQFVKAQVAKLIEAYPELADDEALRLDMIEAETNAKTVIETAFGEYQFADMMASAIKGREEELTARRGRYERKAAAMKALIRTIMQAAKLDKLALTEATLSIINGRSSVGIMDLESIPQGYFTTIRQADKAAIKQAFDRGEDIPGAALVHGERGLKISTK